MDLPAIVAFVQLALPGVQCPPNAVIFKVLALATVAVNEERVQLELTRPNSGVVLVNPVSGECNVVSKPIGLQLAAEAIDGMTNAQNAIAAVKSTMPFLECFLMSTLLVSPDKDAETNGSVPAGRWLT